MGGSSSPLQPTDGELRFAFHVRDKKKPAANELRASSLSRGRLKEQFNHLYDCKPQKKVRKDFSRKRDVDLWRPAVLHDPSYARHMHASQTQKENAARVARRGVCSAVPTAGDGAAGAVLVGSCCEAFTFAYRCRQRLPGCSAWWPTNPKASSGSGSPG